MHGLHEAGWTGWRTISSSSTGPAPAC